MTPPRLLEDGKEGGRGAEICCNDCCVCVCVCVRWRIVSQSLSQSIGWFGESKEEIIQSVELKESWEHTYRCS
jgi:hypothetical protein